MQASFHADVIGITWQGFRSTYTYPLPADSPTDRAALALAVKRAAGDFQTIEDFQVESSATRVIARRRGHDMVRAIRVLCPWHDPDSEFVFQEAQA